CHVDSNCRVSIVDVRGNGHGCIVVSQQDVFAATWFIDLSGDGYPEFLSVADNGVGGRSSVHYRSSTAYYLTDRERGRPWLTRLAMPVIAVERLEHVDEVDGVLNSEQRQYRDGYYDPVERRFRGFGFVQSINSRATNSEQWSFALAALDESQY